MPEDSGREPLPPGRAAVWGQAGPSARAGPLPSARLPEDPPAEAPWAGARFRDSVSPDALFPVALPVLPRLRLSACRRPAAGGPEGDWLDVLVLPDGATALVIGHVRADGGAMAAAGGRLRAGLRGSLREGAAPADALAGLAGAAGSTVAREATACLAVLNPVTGELRYATVGQPGPVICTAAGADGHLAEPASESPGPGAGHPAAGTAIVPAGAVLLLYRNRDSAAGTARRVADLASAVLAGGGSAAPAELADRVGQAVLAGLTGEGAPGPATLLAAHRPLAPVPGWSMNLPADPVALRGLRTRLRDWLHDLGVSASDRTDVELAVWEAAVNAIVHGRPAAGPATITVHADLDDAGRAVVQVADRGRWRAPDPSDPGRRWPGGQGLLVIRQAADDVDISPGPDGTTVTVRRRLSRLVPGQAEPAEYPATAARHGKPA